MLAMLLQIRPFSAIDVLGVFSQDKYLGKMILYHQNELLRFPVRWAKLTVFCFWMQVIQAISWPQYASQWNGLEDSQFYFSPMNAAIQVSISNTFYSPVSHQFNSRLKEALLNYKLYYKTQWLVQRIFREKIFWCTMLYSVKKKFTYHNHDDNRQLISFFFINWVKKCSMQKIPF